MNIGIDTFALFDDSEWEREEVSSNCPQVRVYHPDKIINLSNGPEFNTTITKETEKRRENFKKRFARCLYNRFNINIVFH